MHFRKPLLVICILCVVLLAISPVHPTTRRNYCQLRSKAGAYVRIAGSKDCEELLGTSSRAGFVQIWKTDPLPEGFVKRKLIIPGSERLNITHVNFAFRSAVIDTAPYEHETERLLMRSFVGIWDSPLSPNHHISPSDFFWMKPSPYAHYGSILRRNAPGSDGQEEDWIDCQGQFRDEREYSYWVPKSLFNETQLGPDTYFTFNFTLTYEGKIVNTYLFDLKRHYIPRSKLGICMKPLYGAAVPSMFAECMSTTL